ncbi:cilia- and flagella-associated protein 53-like [Zophobas morio]|uniref:cilia- and flagella-associated protein 53-like n=1 Tax=Zophobas morio TaxID=2755281 RepID=UPI0030829DC6
MKQNELRKETERETDKFYGTVTMKNLEAQVSVIYVIIVTCWRRWKPKKCWINRHRVYNSCNKKQRDWQLKRPWSWKRYKTTAKYDKHSEKTVFQRNVHERFKQKLKIHEDTIQVRRNKLKLLLCAEEQEFIRETITQGQQGLALKLEEMRMNAVKLKAQREEERMKIVEEKHKLQYRNECKDIRPEIVKQILIDTKKTQLQQIKENEMRREAERELNSMWYDLMVKEQQAKAESEMQTLLKNHLTQKETMQTWEKQILGKQLLKQEAGKIAVEDRLEMIKLQEEIKLEQMETLELKKRKREQVAKELKEQILLQEKYIAQRKTEEDALNKAMAELASREIEREVHGIQVTTAKARREAAIYRQHLKELEEERKKEDEHLRRVLAEHKKLVEEKQEEAYCKLKRAKEELQKNVLAERAQQLEYKKQEAEKQSKLKEAENELIRMTCETNERLQAESDRLQAEQVKEYREELKRQMEYTNEKRKLEKEQLQRDLAETYAEEERRRQYILELVRAQAPEHVHPFRRVLTKQTCPCTSPTDNK